MNAQHKISLPVIRRIPRYYRYVGDLVQNGVTNISSSKLAKLMGSTASQVRQDFNSFGGFGQQGIGYNTEVLYKELEALLFKGKDLTAILIGAGSLGHTVAKYIVEETRGMELVAAFDIKPDLIGKTIEGVPVHSMAELESFCEQNHPQVAVACIPKDAAQEMANRIEALNLAGIWNFSHYDFSIHDKNLIIENVHLRDSMMSLEFQINNKG